MHVWVFTAVPGEVVVRTEESSRGAPVEADIAYAQRALDASLAHWVHRLSDEVLRSGDAGYGAAIAAVHHRGVYPVAVRDDRFRGTVVAVLQR